MKNKNQIFIILSHSNEYYEIEDQLYSMKYFTKRGDAWKFMERKAIELQKLYEERASSYSISEDTGASITLRNDNVSDEFVTLFIQEMELGE